jgi:exocyst complex component 1
VVNESYRRINKAMFESLNAIAKEQPMTITAAATQSSNLSNLDPEDKELLNAHIFIIENTFHFIDAFSETDTPNPVLADFIKRGKALYDEHMSLYVSSVIRRPLGKILDFLEPLEATADKEAFILRAPHSRVAFRKLVNHYDTKEIKKGIETLRKRVEKHFAESDEDIISERLLLELVKKLGEAYIDVSERLSAAGRDVYGENGKAGGVEWGREEIWAAFRKN